MHRGKAYQQEQEPRRSWSPKEREVEKHLGSALLLEAPAGAASCLWQGILGKVCCRGRVGNGSGSTLTNNWHMKKVDK